ncbi:jg13335 [Pararge aegeria aegeria]|uniref:Jg13335 protein n=1 Tax=Pararge aegeria aegeria TaxID=348720 RepID=A0A8S4SJL0_9NEOP|nr:jg13335 [Pararge aegeria aegeria]
MSVIGKFVVPNVSPKNFAKIGAALQASKSSRNYFTYTQELSQPLDRKPEILSAKQAFEKCLKSGQTVYAQGAAATPVPLLDAMTDVGKAGNLRDIKVVHMHTEKEAKYVAPEYKDIFRSVSLFMAANVRKSVAEGRSDAIPIFLQDIPKLFHRKIIRPDIALIQVRQLWFLKFTSGYHIQPGTGKKFHKGRIVGSFLVGNKELYDFVDNNPFIEMLEIDYVNNTHVVSLLPDMTAINSCIEVDITGQVCADSIGTRMFSGFGGQVDFIRGAAEAVDGRGKPIIALVSTTKRNESKIVPTLKVGAGVVTTRAHVNYVVTEQGIANLFGKTLRQRAYELIKISHPDHRETLEKAAFERLKCMPAP